MPDTVLSTLASSNKINTINDLLEAVSGWGYVSKYGDEVLLLLKDADREHQLESQEQRTKTRQANKKRKLEDLQRDDELKVLRGSIHSGPGPSTVLPPLVHTRMIDPIVVKHVGQPMEPRPPRPRPRPILNSRLYTRTDVFDDLMDSNLRRM